MTSFMRAVCSSLLVIVVGVAVAAAPVKEDPIEREMLSIASELRCTQCQNEPVSESNAEIARDMRQIIREQLAAGKSRQEVLDFFATRYGDYILMKPRYTGPGFLVWAAPAVLLLFLAIPAFIYLKRRRSAPMPPLPSISDDDRARVRAAKEQLPE